MRRPDVRILTAFLLVLLLPASSGWAASSPVEFSQWLVRFRQEAIRAGISQTTVAESLDKARFLPEVIKADREIDALRGELEGTWGSPVAVSPEPVLASVEATRVIP